MNYLTSHTAAFWSLRHIACIDGISHLAARRRLGLKPLKRSERIADQATRDQLALDLAPYATVEFYGYPSRRSLIAYPLPGIPLETVRTVLNRRTSLSCGNIIFSIA